MNELIDLRDRLQGMADAACDFTSETADGREWDRRHLAALMEAWMILDREVTRLNEVSNGRAETPSQPAG